MWQAHDGVSFNTYRGLRTLNDSIRHDLRDGRTTEVHFYVEKTIEYRLEEAKRMQRNAAFAREARELDQRAQPAMRWSLKSRFTNWASFRVRRETRDGGAA